MSDGKVFVLTTIFATLSTLSGWPVNDPNLETRASLGAHSSGEGKFFLSFTLEGGGPEGRTKLGTSLSQLLGRQFFLLFANCLAICWCRLHPVDSVICSISYDIFSETPGETKLMGGRVEGVERVCQLDCGYLRRVSLVSILNHHSLLSIVIRSKLALWHTTLVVQAKGRYPLKARKGNHLPATRLAVQSGKMAAGRDVFVRLRRHGRHDPSDSIFILFPLLFFRFQGRKERQIETKTK